MSRLLRAHRILSSAILVSALAIVAAGFYWLAPAAEASEVAVSTSEEDLGVRSRSAAISIAEDRIGEDLLLPDDMPNGDVSLKSIFIREHQLEDRPAVYVVSRFNSSEPDAANESIVSWVEVTQFRGGIGTPNENEYDHTVSVGDYTVYVTYSPPVGSVYLAVNEGASAFKVAAGPAKAASDEVMMKLVRSLLEE